jgi:hypothetical protein
LGIGYVQDGPIVNAQHNQDQNEIAQPEAYVQ